ncbi:MAG: bifunctional glutamate N-acetyltransferase/amino-acid acetyltransferase ArgJ [Balneolales bacterium]
MKTITDVKGFKFWGAHTGVKSKRRDLALIYSEKPASVASVYTRNLVVAESIKLCRERKNPGIAQAIVVNSGNANACTGKQGKEGAIAVVKAAAKAMEVPEEYVLLASTGVIGRTFPTDKIVAGVRENTRKLTNQRVAASLISNAILTTDTFPKEHFLEFKINGKNVSMGGIAKGSGMIHPNMGTMLAFIVSDVAIVPELLHKALKEVVDQTFNMITVDGDTSTNDMVSVLCNGEAGNAEINTENAQYKKFKDALLKTCMSLARLIVADGEGSTKFIEYQVINAESIAGARKIIRTVSDSSLVKTAIFGRDPNWGRILAAAGRAGVDFDPDKADLYMGARNMIQLVKNGQPMEQNLTRLKKMMRSTHIKIMLDIHTGDQSATGWGSDFSYEYVRINAEYTT